MKTVWSWPGALEEVSHLLFSPYKTFSRAARQPVTKPEVVLRYHNAKGGVDVTDQYCVYYSFTYISVCKTMFWAMEVGIVNSYYMQ